MKRSECNHLDDYLLGWLAPEEAAAFERHLAQCAACRSECQFQQSISRLLVEQCEVVDTPPAGFAARIESRVRATRRRRLLRLASWASVIAASILVAAFVGGFAVSRPNRSANQLASVPKVDDIEPTRSESPTDLVPNEPNSLLKKGTGSELKSKKPAKDTVCEVPVPLFQQAAKPMKSERLTPSTCVKLLDPSAGIVIDRKTHHPDVRVVWIYPTFRPTTKGSEQINQ